MISTTMMGLGAYRFALSTAAYQSFDREISHRWESVPRLGRRPALQYVGPGEETINLDGIIYPSFKGGLGQLAAMRAEAATGEPRILLDGLGFVWGRWSILRVREGQKVFFADGAPREQAFSLQLSFYGEDEA